METSDGQEDINGADSGWAESEMEGVDLSDARLERRLIRVAEELSGQPEYPINQASEDVAATKAAYRLFDNERVTAEGILSPHRDKTLLRMRDEPVVLAIQDTSFFNFSSHRKTQGLGPIGDSSAKLQGLLLHSTLAVTPKGLPLGLLWQRCWAREGFRESPEAHEDLPIEEKESYRWVEALRDTAKLISAPREGSMLVTVADRESDIYEFLLEAQRLDAKYVIRACHNRRLDSDGVNYIQEALTGIKPQAEIELDVPTQNRRAVLRVTFVPITLRPPDRITTSKQKLQVSCWAIKTQEVHPPQGKDPLSWTLLTNISVASVDSAIEKIHWYRRRWAIEEFHKILKSGCSIEDCRLQTAERLRRYIALFCIIAWRIFWMVHIKRADPSAPADIVLTKTEIGTLCSLKRFKSKIPNLNKLAVKHAVIAVACLGGYLNRRNDPPPGPTVLWRGWQRLSSMAELYESIVPGCG